MHLSLNRADSSRPLVIAGYLRIRLVVGCMLYRACRMERPSGCLSPGSAAAQQCGEHGLPPTLERVHCVGTHQGHQFTERQGYHSETMTNTHLLVSSQSSRSPPDREAERLQSALTSRTGKL